MDTTTRDTKARAPERKRTKLAVGGGGNRAAPPTKPATRPADRRLDGWSDQAPDPNPGLDGFK